MLPQAICSEELKDVLDQVHETTRARAIVAVTSVMGHRAYAAVGGFESNDAERTVKRIKFTMGCAIQLIVAIATIELSRKGLLDLEAPIGEHLPELAGCTVGSHVRVCHLLSHTSGYDGWDIGRFMRRCPDWATLTAFLRTTPQLFTPGAVYSQSYADSAVVGELIRRITCTRWEKIADDLLSTPLLRKARPSDLRVIGCRPSLSESSGWVHCRELPPPVPLWSAAVSTLRLSLSELVEVAERIIGMVQTDNRLPDATRSLLLEPFIRLPQWADLPQGCYPISSFGLGAATFLSNLHGIDGAGAGQVIGVRFSPRCQSAIAVGLVGGDFTAREKVIQAISRAVGVAPEEEQHITRATYASLSLDDYVGSYHGFGRTYIQACMESKTLHLAMGKGASARGAIVRINKDERGAPRIRPKGLGLPLALFREPVNHVPSLMIQYGAYKRL